MRQDVVVRTGCWISACALVLLAGCGKGNGTGGSAEGATQTTVAVNAQFAKDLKLEDQQDFEDAKRGFIAKPSGKILAADGTVIFMILTFNSKNLTALLWAWQGKAFFQQTQWNRLRRATGVAPGRGLA